VQRGDRRVPGGGDVAVAVQAGADAMRRPELRAVVREEGVALALEGGLARCVPEQEALALEPAPEVVFLGLALGVVPLFRAIFGPVVTLIAVIPPIAVLPILFIALGLGETAKIALIAFGIAPYMTRDIAGFVAALPREQFIKAQTLGANSWQVAIRVALPQLMPRLIEGLRLSMGPAWVFLIAAEAIASDVGLGYRIFLVRRYLAMDIILPYVAWISLLAIAADALLRWLSRRAFGWAHGASQ